MPVRAWRGTVSCSPESSSVTHQSLDHRVGEDFVDDAAALGEHAIDYARRPIAENDAIWTDAETSVILQRAFERLDVPLTSLEIAQRLTQSAARLRCQL